MERPLSDWERRVLVRLASVEGDQAPLVRESLEHLVVTGGCGCGCRSFDVRDRRFPAQPHHLGHFSNGWTQDKSFGFALWTGPDGRPLTVDVFDNRPEGAPPEWPDPDELTVEVAVAANCPSRRTPSGRSRR